MPVLSSRIVMRVFLPAFIFPVNCKLCVTGKATGNNSAGHGCEPGLDLLPLSLFVAYWAAENMTVLCYYVNSRLRNKATAMLKAAPMYITPYSEAKLT